MKTSTLGKEIVKALAEQVQNACENAGEECTVTTIITRPMLQAFKEEYLPFPDDNMFSDFIATSMLGSKVTVINSDRMISVSFAEPANN